MALSANAAALRARRRIGFLAAVALLAVGVLALRLWALTIWQGEAFREEAEARLDRSIWLPTIRGSILDRKGRVLAQDVPAWDVALDYSVLNGSWVRERATREARRDVGRAVWSKLTAESRERVLQPFMDAWQRRLDGVLDEVARQCDVPRATIEERMREITTRVERRAESTWARQREQLAKRGDDAAEKFKPEPIREQRMSHVVVHQVPDAVAFAMRKIGDATPGTVEVLDGTRRVQPWRGADVRLDGNTLPTPLRKNGDITVRVEGVLDQVLGSVRDELWAEDVARRPFTRPDGTVDPGGYGPTPDAIGSRGIEQAYEGWLRGERGQLRERLDTNEMEREDPKPGRDLKLTIDAALQARVQAVLNPRLGLTKVQPWQHGGKSSLPDGTSLASAAVVIDVETGEVLAMGSWPTAADAADLSPSDQSRLAPGLNRAAEAVYPPGSIVKPLVYAGAVTKGKFSSSGSVDCNGHFFPELKDKARCWIWRPEHGMNTHTAVIGGPLPVEAAVSRSCNIYFYTVANRFGLRNLVSWYHDMGLGQRLGTGLQGPGTEQERGEAGEAAGILPSDDDMAKLEQRHDAFTPIILGIGQGPMAWTPLQAANAYATLARGGELRDARVVMDDAALPADRRSGSLNIPEEARRRALEGLRQAVEEPHGTGHHVKYGDGTSEVVFDVPGVQVRGKTGTAQAPPLAYDDNGDGTRDHVVRGLDHSWFVGLVNDRSDDTPKYAVAVLVEYGGSGGKTAGPVAEQLVHALVEEGYLNDSHADEGGKTKGTGKKKAGRPRYAPEPDETPAPDRELPEA
ncbi:MAG: peptidoglycan D,D-transpeptidase FtsI family protein [Phycisphaerales bacterium]